MFSLLLIFPVDVNYLVNDKADFDGRRATRYFRSTGGSPGDVREVPAT